VNKGTPKETLVHSKKKGEGKVGEDKINGLVIKIKKVVEN